MYVSMYVLRNINVCIYVCTTYYECMHLCMYYVLYICMFCVLWMYLCIYVLCTLYLCTTFYVCIYVLHSMYILCAMYVCVLCKYVDTYLRVYIVHLCCSYCNWRRVYVALLFMVLSHYSFLCGVVNTRHMRSYVSYIRTLNSFYILKFSSQLLAKCLVLRPAIQQLRFRFPTRTWVSIVIRNLL